MHHQRRVVVIFSEANTYIVGTECTDGTHGVIEEEIKATVQGRSRAYTKALNMGETMQLPVYDQWPGREPFLIQGHPLKGFACPLEAHLRLWPSGPPSSNE